jgi:tetratricopeptide (TPR) repeat protein
VCAFLHPDAIPEAILIEGAVALGPQLQEVVTDPLLLNEAIQLLRRYSLVKRDAEAKLLNMHRLVQVVLKESLDEATRQQWAERSVRAVASAFPSDNVGPAVVASWPRCEQCLPHVQVCLELIDHYSFSFSEAAHLLNQAGIYLWNRGRFDQAQPLLQRALAICEKVLGPEHPETASTLNNLAWLYGNQGKYEQAEPLYLRALAILEKTLGPEHPWTAVTLCDLADLYRNQGKYEQAEPLFQRALAICEKVLGPEHPQTATVLDAQGHLALLQGREEQAASRLQRALTIHEHALGNMHPSVAETLHHLAELSEKHGKHEQVHSFYQRALAIREQALGSEHPDSIATREALARLQQTLQEQDGSGSALPQAG